MRFCAAGRNLTRADSGPGRGDSPAGRGRANDWASTACAAGRLAEPVFSCDSRRLPASRGRPEQIFREHFEAESAATNGDLGEHLWLLGAVGITSNPREGEIFFPRKGLAVIVGFFGRARGYSRRRPVKLKNEPNNRPGATARRSVMSKSATKEGTTRYAQKFAGAAPPRVISRDAEVGVSPPSESARISGSRTQKTDEG